MNAQATSPGPVPRALRTRRRVLCALIGVALAGGTAVAVAVHRDSSKGAPQSAPVASVTVQAVAPMLESFDRSIAATGTIAARDELLVGSDASGVRLVEVLVDVGTVVRKGDLLARADDAQLRAMLSQQEAQLRQALADQAQAQRDLTRARQLVEAGFYSIEAGQTKNTAALSADARVDFARAQLRELEVRLAQTRVLAPAAGVVSRRAATVGAVVQPGAELFRVIRDGELEWQAELPGHAIAAVEPGATVRIAVDDGRSIEGHVRLVAPTVDRGTRTGLVHVSLPPDAPFKAGEHARGEILQGSVEALSLPESSILVRDGYAFVYVLGDDDVAHSTRIATGARRAGRVEVTEGLTGGVRVVGTGAGFVKEGDLVRVADVVPQQVAPQGDKP